MNLARQEQHQPEYLAINPLGVVPTIIHNGQPLHESSTICEYLDSVFPEPPLLPKDPYTLAKMRNWVRHVDGLIGNLIRFNWRHHIQKTAEKMSDAELDAMMNKIPSAERREAWQRVARKPYTEEELQESRGKLVTMLDDMEAMMSGDWLFEGGYSLGDIAVVPFVKRVSEEIAPDAFSTSQRPKVVRWWDAVQKRPAFDRAKFAPFATSY